MARATPEDKFAGLAEPGMLARDIPDLDLIDPKLPTVGELETQAQILEEAAFSIQGVSKSGGASASAGIGGMVLVTSHGFRGAYIGSNHGLSMTAIDGDGIGMERDYDYSSVRHAVDLERPEDIGRRAGERAVARLNPRKVSTCKVSVLFDPRSAGSLVSHLASAVNGASVARKTSFLRDKMGAKLFADGIRIVDDPLRRRGLRSHPFDGEGVVCKAALIEDGVLRSWLLDSATARELGLVTTGNAQRSGSSATSPGSSNLYMEPGRLSPEQLIADIADGFYVTDLIGVGANMITGDYSRGASGFWIENGKRVYPVSEVTIAGHLTDMFRTLTPANDLSFRYGINAPTLRVEGLTVAGE
jgi:PmbA protein